MDHFNLSCLADNDGGFHRRTTSLWAHCADSCTAEQHVSEERCKKDARGMQEESPDTAHFYQHEFTGRFPEYHCVFLWSASQLKSCVVVTCPSLSNGGLPPSCTEYRHCWEKGHFLAILSSYWSMSWYSNRIMIFCRFWIYGEWRPRLWLLHNGRWLNHPW